MREHLPLGEAAVGPLAELIGLGTTLLAGAAALVLATGAAVGSSSVRDLRRTEYGGTPAGPTVSR